MQASAFFMRAAHSSAQDRQLQHDSLVRQLARPELSGLLGNRCAWARPPPADMFMLAMQS